MECRSFVWNVIGLSWEFIVRLKCIESKCFLLLLVLLLLLLLLLLL